MKNEYLQMFSSSQYEMCSCFIASGRDRDGKVLLYVTMEVAYCDSVAKSGVTLLQSIVDFERVWSP